MPVLRHDSDVDWLVNRCHPLSAIVESMRSDCPCHGPYQNRLNHHCDVCGESPFAFLDVQPGRRFVLREWVWSGISSTSTGSDWLWRAVVACSDWQQPEIGDTMCLSLADGPDTLEWVSRVYSSNPQPLVDSARSSRPLWFVCAHNPYIHRDRSSSGVPSKWRPEHPYSQC